MITNAEDDYSTTTRNVFFEAGETSVTVDVPIQDDMILEDTEFFSATLMSQLPNVLVFENASNADIAILDNDRKGGTQLSGQVYIFSSP